MLGLVRLAGHRHRHRREGARPAAAAGRSSSTAGARPPGLDALAWAEKVARLGAGELLLTSMDRDGRRDGYDLELVRAVADAVGDPGDRERRRRARWSTCAPGLVEGHASAALAASIFHSREHSIGEAKRYLAQPWRARAAAGGGMSEPLDASVTLEEVFSVVGSKRVPLAPELAGYLALEHRGEPRRERRPGRLPRVSTSVRRERSRSCKPRQASAGDAEASLRKLLAKLLEAGGAQTPSLAAVAQEGPRRRRLGRSSKSSRRPSSR